MRRRRTCALVVLLVLSIGLLGVVLVLLNTLSRPPDPGPAQQFFAARDAWAHRPFKRYRMIVEQEGGLQPRCRQEFEVEDEQVDTVISNGCAGSMPTVSDLFARIEDYTTKVVCGPNGCDCDGQIVARATYDPRLGYPHDLVIMLQPQRRFNPLEWFRPTTCTLIGFSGGPTITVVTLTPLP